MVKLLTSKAMFISETMNACPLSTWPFSVKMISLGSENDFSPRTSSTPVPS